MGTNRSAAKPRLGLSFLLAISMLVGCGGGGAKETASAPDESAMARPSGDEVGFDSDLGGEMTDDSNEMFAAESAAEEEPFLVEPAHERVATARPKAAEPVVEPPPELAIEFSPALPATEPDESGALSDASRSEASRAEAENPPVSTGPFESLPAGATHHADKGYATVAVYYATDRGRDAVPLSSYGIAGNRDAFILLTGCSVAFFICAGIYLWRSRSEVALSFGLFGGISGTSAIVIIAAGAASIEKSGVRYTAERGELVRGVCEVTVPDTHDRGVVERPSLLRFEIREDQKEHIVLTSATELTKNDFHRRLADTVATSPNQDMLVFVHGYNVDFESAVRRTAQLSVDLPFEGVPVCYSWPSQARLLAYTVDENTCEWTQTHLKQFLLELASESGAKSINVIAHSMGNRPTTGALLEMGWELGLRNQPETEAEKVFDRVVLAAPDVDAGQFKRDLAPALLEISNHVTLYASSDDQALIASKQVHGYPRAGESGSRLVVVPGIETIDVSGIDLSLLGHSYYGDSKSMLRDLYQVIRDRMPAHDRELLVPRPFGTLTYYKLKRFEASPQRISSGSTPIR